MKLKVGTDRRNCGVEFPLVASPEAISTSWLTLCPSILNSAPLRISGLTVEVCKLLDREVDVFAAELLKSRVSGSAMRDAVKW